MDTFLQARIDLVKQLRNSSEIRVEYADCALITCAVISACAAHRWPGRAIDKKRFLELLVTRSDTTFRATWVSIPALLGSGLIDVSQTPWGKPGHDSRILSDEDDVSLTDAQARFPQLSMKDLRNHCYAMLIYERLRCAYSHEYCIGENMNIVPASRRADRVSYITRDPPKQRRIHFHLDYLLDLAQHHVANLAAVPEPLPAQWWAA